MIARTSVPLRWSEQAEAAQLCALAVFECEPYSATARLVARGIACSGSQPSLAARLVDWLAQPALEIIRDVNWPDGLS